MNDTEENFIGEKIPLWSLILLTFLYFITSANGILGSVLILKALTNDDHFRTVSYTIYLGNLVITDIYLQIYNFPMIILSNLLGRYPAVNEAHCTVIAYLTMTCYSVFLLTLTAISFDRYMRVCHDSIHKQHFSRKASLCICIMIWILGCMVPIHAALRNWLGFDKWSHSCFTKSTGGSTASLPYLSFLAFSLLASGYFNLKIYTVYRAARRRIQQHSEDHRQQNSDSVQLQKKVSSSDMALLRSLVVIFTTLVLFVTPGSVARGLRSKFKIPNVVFAFFLWLLSLNSSINWIVYGLLNPRFRNAYKRLLQQNNIYLCGKASVTTSSMNTSVA